MRYFLLLLALGTLQYAQAQTSTDFTVSGKILDSQSSEPIIGATVQMVNVKDSTKSIFAVTDIDGNFTLTKLEQAFYRLNVRSIGYDAASSILRIRQTVDLGVITLVPNVKELDEVEISANVVPVEQKGDTTQYNAAAFKTHADANGDELVAKMPGIVVDDSGVTANGEAVEQVLLDGKRFFGTDPLLTLKNIPADIIDKIQVYDELSDQAKFTGYDDGNTVKTMNVVTKTNRRNGQFGKFYAGYGTNERYSAGASVNSFKGNSRLSVLGMSNNINVQDFSNEDLVGMSSGGGRGGGRGSGSSGFTSNQSQSGITATNTIGFNYSNEWNDRTELQMSYFYNHTNNEVEQQVLRTTSISEVSQVYTENSSSSAENGNHRFNLRLDHELNDKSKLLIRSNFNTQQNDQKEATLAETVNSSDEIVGSTDNTYDTENNGISISNEIIYQYKLNSLGRTIQASFSHGWRPVDRKSIFQDIEADSLLDYTTKEDVNEFTGRLSYTEPVGNFGQLQVDYEVNQNNRKSDIETLDKDLDTGESVLVEGLSSDFASGYTTHQPSVSLGFRNYERHINARLSYQNASLSSTQKYPYALNVDATFNNLLVFIMGRLPIGENGNFHMHYQTESSMPSVSQLQEVIDNRNPLFLSVGNADLRNSYSHNLMGRFHISYPESDMTLSNFSMVKYTTNYIGQSTLVLTSDSTLQGDVTAQSGAQISQPVNLDGYWNVQNSTTFGKLISPIKSNINTTLTVGYTSLPGLINGETNRARTLTGGLRLVLASNISENVDFNLFSSLSANRVNNSLESTSDSKYMTYQYGGKINLTFPKGFVFRSNLSHLKYLGVSSSGDVSYTLWNMSVAKKLFENKLGEVELSVFDVLGQNQSVSQQVTSSYVQETHTDVLQTYLMLSFKYKIRHFKG